MEARTALVDGKRYPFLVDYVSALRARLGISDLGVIVSKPAFSKLVTERVRWAVEKARAPDPAPTLLEELISFYGAVYVAKRVGDRWLLSRLSLAEAARAQELLESEPGRVVEAVARAVGIGSFTHHEPPLKVAVARLGGLTLYNTYEFSVTFIDYVKYAKRLLGDPSWKPVNLPVWKGRVFLDKGKAVRLVKEAVEMFINRLAETVEDGSEPPDQILNDVKSMLEKVRRPRIAKEGGRYPRIVVEKGVIVEEAFPPCMKDILERARRGEHLSHHERFAIATFLLQIGAEIDQVVDVFRNMPDFNEKITRYQVEHLAGLRGSMKKYKTYSCEKMRTLGLCKADCGVRSPIQYYYRALARMMRKRRKADEGDKGSQ